MELTYSKLRIIFLFSIILTSTNTFKNTNSATENIKFNNEIHDTNGYQVIKISQPRQTVYTQGLILSNDGRHLYESGGLYNKSTLKKFSYPSLNLENQQMLSGKYFAEGIAKCGNVLYQLTWQENDILKYNFDDLTPIGKIRIDENMREGWGLTEYSNDHLLGTDGSEYIYFLNCNKNLKVEKRILVKEDENLIRNLNALIYVNGYIYANRYYDTKIYKINPDNGNVERTYEMSPLIKHELKKGILTNTGLRIGNVLNGIAYDRTRDIFILTGKLWGYFYEIKFEN